MDLKRGDNPKLNPHFEKRPDSAKKNFGKNVLNQVLNGAFNHLYVPLFTFLTGFFETLIIHKKSLKCLCRHQQKDLSSFSA
jgi:hypothetical protein